MIEFVGEAIATNATLEVMACGEVAEKLTSQEVEQVFDDT